MIVGSTILSQQTTALKLEFGEHCIWTLLGTTGAKVFSTHFRLSNFQKSSPWHCWLCKAKENFIVKTNFATRGYSTLLILNAQDPLDAAYRKRLKVSLGKPKERDIPNIISYIVFSSDIKYIHDRQMTKYKN